MEADVSAVRRRAAMASVSIRSSVNESGANGATPTIIDAVVGDAAVGAGGRASAGDEELAMGFSCTCSSRKTGFSRTCSTDGALPTPSLDGVDDAKDAGAVSAGFSGITNGNRMRRTPDWGKTGSCRFWTGGVYNLASSCHGQLQSQQYPFSVVVVVVDVVALLTIQKTPATKDRTTDRC